MQKGFIAKQNYIKELTVFEHIILWSNIGILIAFFIAQLVVYKNWDKWQTWLTFSAGIVSAFSVMAGVKKKPLCPLLGVIGSVLLAPIAWDNHAYATMIMFGLNFIAQTISFITWIRNSDRQANVKVRNIRAWQIIVYITIIIGLIALYTWVEGLPGYVHFMHGTEIPRVGFRIIDSSVLMFSIACFIPMIFRLKFVWLTYILTDTAELALWIYQLVSAVNNLNHWMMLVSVLGLLVTSILGFVRWYKNSKNNKK